MLTMPIQLQEYLSSAAINYPNKIAIICDDQRYTYQEIDLLSNQLAHALLENGLVRGERVMLCLENGVDAVILFWATMKAGGVVSIVSPAQSLQKILYIIQDSGAKFLFLQQDSRILPELKNRMMGLNKIIVLGSDEKNEEIINYSSFFSEKNSLPLCKSIDMDLATIIYTSGSTSLPKGVMLTHRNMLSASMSINSYLKLNHQDVIISALPLSFDYGLYQVILTFLNGATLILEKDFSWPIHFFRKIFQEKATVFPGVATMFSILENHIQCNWYDLGSIRCVTNTGATLLEKHIKIIEKTFPHAQLFSMYGLTECKRCTYLPPEDILSKPKSLGVAIPNTEMWIVDSNDKKLAPRQIGQLVVRGSTVMKGYWNQEAESEKVLKPGCLPGEHVLYTGDFGYLDEQGYFYFCGRQLLVG